MIAHDFKLKNRGREIVRKEEWHRNDLPCRSDMHTYHVPISLSGPFKAAIVRNKPQLLGQDRLVMTPLSG
ncbi:hypothetical protein POX_f07470 [Penicillium oxalicum]|uniref:hypothetical protein n=1 Tax=Penicillium oxalicum TaxID=69781 RepID=UPI0020B8D73C|nr:hypothetical protein POX_f07470 [Penicillium oxalicum]KAI2787111.1 hypothetical protein POX_f07470 [Penicillium oxalicum]